MSARNLLLDLYRQWRDLTEAEGEAIQHAAWNRVDQCQNAKYRLQSQIVNASQQFHSELAPNLPEHREAEDQFRDVVRELILLETRNGELLAEQREKACQEKAQLDLSSRHLRQVQKAYSPGRGAAWVAYS